MTSIGVVSPSARTEYECNECDIPILMEQPYVRSNRAGRALKIHLQCVVPLIKHGWIWLLRLPNGDEYRAGRIQGYECIDDFIPNDPYRLGEENNATT